MEIRIRIRLETLSARIELRCSPPSLRVFSINLHLNVLTHAIDRSVCLALIQFAAIMPYLLLIYYNKCKIQRTHLLLLESLCFLHFCLDKLKVLKY